MERREGGGPEPAWSFPLCPVPPAQPDWEALTARFPWLQAMAGCPQDPVYHSEGDVLTHTRMVAEALIALPAWHALAAVDRSILFAAALLHDVAKPRCTEQGPDGRISARGHARLGARMAQHILWRTDDFVRSPVPPAGREAIVRLVRLHGLPLYLLDEPDPQHALIRASQTVRCDWLALLAEADVRGRSCTDQRHLLERIELFRAYAQEQRCLDGPRLFPSDHSRFLYFRGEQRDPEYHAYDDTRCEASVMSGLPGAGKDTYIRRYLAGTPVISLDALRSALGVAPHGDQGKVVATALEQARSYLRAGQDFVWNATNTTRRSRGRLITLFAAYRARIRIVYVEAPLAMLRQRNAARARPVPEAVVDKLIDGLEVPDLTEAHAVTWADAL